MKKRNLCYDCFFKQEMHDMSHSFDVCQFEVEEKKNFKKGIMEFSIDEEDYNKSCSHFVSAAEIFKRIYNEVKNKEEN